MDGSLLWIIAFSWAMCGVIYYLVLRWAGTNKVCLEICILFGPIALSALLWDLYKIYRELYRSDRGK
jgi:hypothetical protein